MKHFLILVIGLLISITRLPIRWVSLKRISPVFRREYGFTKKKQAGKTKPGIKKNI